MVEKMVLKNGVRIVSEHLPHLRSCAIGIWVESGSRHEPEELCGISHFIEHMMFKGTETYTAAQLAEEFDAIGGQVNAFTTKENTCYYARTLDTHFKKAADLLCDMYFNSTFSQKEADLERGVILEEIGMYEDTPEDLCNELLAQKIYDGYSLARPILGTKESLSRIGGKELMQYCRSNYAPQNTLVSICGSFSPEDLQYFADKLGAMPAGQPPRMPEAAYQPGIILKKKDIEQNHLLVAFPGIPLGSDDRFTMQALNNILGAGMSSRLFQKVREQSGLCYSIYSFASLYAGTGFFSVYTALGKDTEQQALEHIRDEINRFKQGGVTAVELQRTKEQLKANVLMGLENTISRMSTVARNELIYGRAVSEEEIVRGIDAVTADSIAELSARVMDFEQMSFSAVGNVADEDTYLNLLRK